VWRVAAARSLPLRTAATVLGVGRMAEALQERSGAQTSELAS